jgi:hypothetical protein
MEVDNLLVFVAVLAVVLSAVGTVVTYNSLSSYNNFFTGFAVEQGVVNVTVDSLASIEIYSAGGVEGSKNITWGSGRVAPGLGNYAILATNGTVSGADPGAEWTPINGGFLIRNIGNSNVTLDVNVTSTASAFIGGTSPLFQYNVSNLEAGSCSDFQIGENTYHDFLDSATRVCNVFQFYEASDEIRMDILLKIPSDSHIGERSSTVVLSYSVI